MAEPTEVIARWRAPVWFRVVFCGAAALLAGTSLVIGLGGEPKRVGMTIVLVALAGYLAVFALRPGIDLTHDTVVVRGHIVARRIPLSQLADVELSRAGLVFWYGEHGVKEAPLVGEQNLLGGGPSSEERADAARVAILVARDIYLRDHGLGRPADPRDTDERLGKRFREGGFSRFEPWSHDD